MVALTGCAFQKLTVMPKSSEATVLSVIREDAAFSLNHSVNVFLNDIEITKLDADSHKSLHVLPGVYKVRFEIFGSDNKFLKEITWTSPLEANDVYIAIVAYNFGWKSWEKFFSGKAGATLAGGQNSPGNLT